jgi:hypothetical protein
MAMTAETAYMAECVGIVMPVSAFEMCRGRDDRIARFRHLDGWRQGSIAVFPPESATKIRIACPLPPCKPPRGSGIEPGARDHGNQQQDHRPRAINNAA